MSSDGKRILSGTRQITGGHALLEVNQVLKEALEDLGEEIPQCLAEE